MLYVPMQRLLMVSPSLDQAYKSKETYICNFDYATHTDGGTLIMNPVSVRTHNIITLI